MPRIHRKTRARTGYTPSHVHALAVGDFFGSFSDADEMREAWADEELRAAVYRLIDERREAGKSARRIPWAEEVFGNGEAVSE